MKVLVQDDYNLKLESDGKLTREIPMVFTVYDMDYKIEDFAKLVKPEEYGRKLFVWDFDIVPNGEKGTVVEVKHKDPDAFRDSGHDDLAEAYIRVKSELQAANGTSLTVQKEYDTYVNTFFNSSQSEFLMFRKKAVKIINTRSKAGRQKTFTYNQNAGGDFVGLMLGAFYDAGYTEIADTEKRGGIGDFFRANNG